MKKLIASAGLIAVGTAGLHAENTASLTRQEASKPWSVSAALRGFYDDNYATAPDNTSLKKGSFGIEISPTFSWNLPRDATYIGLSYTYDLKYYFSRTPKKDDQSHEFTGKFDHRFSNRSSLTFEDSFAYSSEPELIDQSQATPLRTDASAVRNRADIKFRGTLTEVFGYEVGYQNSYYDYLDEGEASHSALLDRFEHAIHLNANWQLREQTLVLVGYQFGAINYTGSESIFATTDPFTGLPILDPNTGLPVPVVKGSSRNQISHYLYAGGEHHISSKLSLDGKVGAQFTVYDDPTQGDSVNPYLDVDGRYTYLPGSSIRLGFRHERGATDIVGTRSDPTADQARTIVYAELTHKITPSVTGSLTASYQHSLFSGGSNDGQADDFFLLGLNFNYHINQYWSAEAGYNWDKLESDLPNRAFTRNRVYVGVRAAY